MGWLRIFRSSREFQGDPEADRMCFHKIQAIKVRTCVSKLWTLESVHKLVVCALSVRRLWSDARVFDRPARHPLSERSFFLPSFFLSCFYCGVPFARACVVVFCACVRNALLCVACCARSPGRVLRLRCEGGIGGPLELLFPPSILR